MFDGYIYNVEGTNTVLVYKWYCNMWHDLLFPLHFELAGYNTNAIITSCALNVA